MSNTIDSSLAHKQLTAQAIPILQQRTRGLAAFSTLVTGSASVSGGTTFLTPVVTTASGMLSNPGSWQTGDVTMTPGTVAATHIARVGHVSKNELNIGFTRAQIVPTLARKFAADLIATFTTPISAAGFGASLGTVTETDFAESTVELLVDAVDGTPRCLLTSAKAIHGIRSELYREGGIWIMPGLEGGVFEMTLGAASNNASAVVATPEAVVGVIAQPIGIQNLGAELQISPLTIDGLGVAGWIVTWIDKATRAEWVSVEALVGTIAGQSTALRFVASS